MERVTPTPRSRSHSRDSPLLRFSTRTHFSQTRVTKLARGAPLGSDSNRPGETRVERRRMVRAMVVVGARRHERVLIRAPRRAAAIPSAARGAAELAAIPCPRVARGSMRGWTIVGPFHRGPDLHGHGGRGKGEILDRDADDRA